MASIKDVAQKARVGVGTVSRVLNGTGYVAQTTKRKVLAAVEELNYTPNELARNLFRNRTGIVGVIIPSLEHPFFSSFCKEAEMELYKNGYKAMVCNTIEVSSREQDYLDMLQRNMVDGIITGAHSLDDSVYQKIGKPIVALDRDMGPSIPVIHSDHVQGGRMAAEKLISNGCKNIIQFTGASVVKSPSMERHDIFSQMVRAQGIHLITVETAWNAFTFEYFYQTMRVNLERYPDIDGIFTMDIPAVCCCDILQDMGRSVPQDVRIVAYDGTYLVLTSRPTITVVRQDISLLAKACVKTLLKRINGDNDFPHRQVYSVEMQDGGSTL